MFFPERILNISTNDRVLEIGPGGTPHKRSDVFLEKKFETETEYKEQRGHTHKIEYQKPIYFYSNEVFPFKDKEFDYVICSHVLEHVENIDAFLSELQRVSRKGYIEFPTIYYDYIYNFSVHKTFLYWNGDTINWLPKADTQLHLFSPVQSLFYFTLQKDYFTFIEDLKPFFIQGFEWANELKFQKVQSIDKVCFSNELIEGLYKNLKINSISKNHTSSLFKKTYQHLKNTIFQK